MKKLLYLMFLLLTLNVYAINHMDEITTMTGDFDGAALGWSLASLDFNGDGYKDLVAQEKNWNPSGVMDFNQMYGKIYFYWSGTNFDNVPDFSITGTSELRFGIAGIINAGDVNGDGIEDLAVAATDSDAIRLLIYYGSSNPSVTPDVNIPFPDTVFSYFLLTGLGDINNDGCDDIGLSLCKNNSTWIIKIIQGGSNNITDLIGTNSSCGIYINGIGDVNADGISDYHIEFPLTMYDNSQFRLTVYYGSSSFPDIDSLVICPNTNLVIDRQAGALGDVNGDGVDDFLSYISSEGGKVWFGSSNLSTNWNVQLSGNVIHSSSTGEVVSHGDFNNDGYEDFIGAIYDYAGNNGRAYIWLGGANFNGTSDLTLTPPNGVAEMYGFAKVTGDFNSDGYCDVAISQPGDVTAPLWTQGRIHIYSGNADLEDTTIANEDNTIPTPDCGLWDITIYPNPLPTGKFALNISFTGDGYSKSTSNLKLTVYNIKGQKLDSYKISGKDIAKKSWKGILKSQPAGEYLISISDKKTRLITKSIMIQ